MPYGVFLKDLIMQPTPEMEVEVINGDPLDCRRSNLRLVRKGTATPLPPDADEPFALLNPSDPIPTYAVYVTPREAEELA